MQIRPALPYLGADETIGHSDDALQSAARAALQAAGYRALADLNCHVVNGAIVLSGTVPTYYLKQIAQTVVLRLGPTLRLDNCVHVRRP